MASVSYDTAHVKRRRRDPRRRRVNNRNPVSAKLVLDHHIQGDVGILSDDLAVDLFPGSSAEALAESQEVRYIAISPWSPHNLLVDDLLWTIIPMRLQSATKSQSSPLSPSTANFPASSGSIQSFVQAFEMLDPTRNSISSQREIEIHVLAVVPLYLDTVYVTVERHLLSTVDDIQNKFGGGFGPGAQGSSGLWAKRRGSEKFKTKHDEETKETAAGREERLIGVIREAISIQRVLHAGDLLPLPLPSHPITHATPPPAKISFCEPVSQGLVKPTTRMVLVETKSRHESRISKGLPSPGQTLLKEVVEDEGDDTSNEQFYSAAEEKSNSTSMESTSPPDESDTEVSPQSDSDASDDSLDDMISLTAPELPPQPSGTMSAMTSVTPRPDGKRFDIHTPGSMLSSFTNATTRAGRSAGKTFRAEGLLARIPNEILHPKPREFEDSDSFVYVDIHTLAKIGCFSGDWVRIEAAEEPQLNMLSSLKFDSLSGLTDNAVDDITWRAVKVYGLPGLISPKPRYSMNTSSTRRPTISQLPSHRFTPTALVPPILLNNLGNPKYLKLSPISVHGYQQASSRPGVQLKSSSLKMPPVAKEVTLLKISTPLSMDRSLQPALFAGLKRYFESKQRLVKSGDLIGISVDEELGKTIYSSTKSPDVGEDEDVAVQLGLSPDPQSRSQNGLRKVGVAWFRVSQVVPAHVEGLENSSDDERWGRVAVIDTSSTRMVQAGSEISPVPGTLHNGWEYWLGVKPLPKPNNETRKPHLFVSAKPKIFAPSVQKRLRDLISTSTSSRAIQLGMKPVVVLLTSTQRAIGKSTVAYRACAEVGLHTFAIDSYDILAEGGANGGDVKTEAFLKARADRAFTCGTQCTALLIQHIDVLTADRMVTAMKDIVADARVMIATTTDIEKVPEGIRSLFTHEFEMAAPDEKEREGILRNVIHDQGIKISADVDLASVAVKTAALVAGDLVDVVERAVAAKSLRLQKLAEDATTFDESLKVTVRDVQTAGGDAARCVTKEDFDAAVDAARKNFADAIGAPKIPNVSWDDVGGLTNVKDAVMETIQLPLERPELFAKGMKKRSGILFYGPPGTGKTLLAKAIATEFSLNFFSVKGPELLNMYIGESEANVRRVFQRARDARPCVVFFDELDSVAPKRGNQGDSGGVMDRIVSQLLAELDGMSAGDENGGGVFVIGATNRPDLLDAALLRPGRFDKMLYLGVSDTHEKQVTILEALTRKFNLHPDLSLRRIAEQLPFTYTGADLYALCSDAMLKAITRQATAVDEKIKALPGGPVTTAYFFDHLATPEDIAVMVTEQDFIAAKAELVASVSAKELEHFERVRRTFESVDDAKKPKPNISASPETPSRAPLTIGEAANGLKPGTSPEDTLSTAPTNTTNDNKTAAPSTFPHRAKHGHMRISRGKGKTSISGAKVKGTILSSSPDQYSESEEDAMSSPVGDDNVTNSNGAAARGWKGKGNAKDAVVCDSIMTVKGGEAENEGKEDEDEYVIRTDHLVRNDKRS
ncbi:peroxisomal biogenesis factor 6 [Histoplasma capsulatum G186AR]|uniref:Peroxisomal ATPase PEX6 n=2 Tax=Ajellomyces capsulatus TaxID=5037 RepID=C0NUQ0_AJECG|nr:peroxisomal biogenesis factor 6 [Histoplasma capsulatum G186AR]EEH04713.1 peroxisomal biogenesis factor 6 [Histoplasma capsulatum G186AR]